MGVGWVIRALVHLHEMCSFGDCSILQEHQPQLIGYNPVPERLWLTLLNFQIQAWETAEQVLLLHLLNISYQCLYGK